MLTALTATVTMLLFAAPLFAAEAGGQPPREMPRGMGGGMMDGACAMCEMQGPWMWLAGTPWAVLLLAAIAALVALTACLWRRSRRPAGA